MTPAKRIRWLVYCGTVAHFFVPLSLLWNELSEPSAATFNLIGSGLAFLFFFFAGRGDISAPPPISGHNNAQRRSQRVMIKVSVMVLVEGAENKPVSEETRTVTVNAHGAMILLGLKVSIGQLLTLRNSRTGEEVACRVVYVSPHQSEKRQVGVDFMKPCPRFWRISFPPSDWTTRSPEAKGNPTKQK